jgi:hypothetical protein
VNRDEWPALYVVTRHPSDFPRHIVVRLQVAEPGGVHHAPIACLYESFADAETDHVGLTWIDRYADDDSVILGCWL